MGTVGIRFSTIDSLKDVKHNKALATLVKSINCIKIHARVRENTNIAELMDFMNGIRKISSKHLVVNILKPLNTTLLEKIIINYEVTIREENTGSTA